MTGSITKNGIYLCHGYTPVFFVQSFFSQFRFTVLFPELFCSSKRSYSRHERLPYYQYGIIRYSHTKVGKSASVRLHESVDFVENSVVAADSLLIKILTGLVLFLLLSKSNVRVFSLVAKTNLRNKNFKNHVAFPFQTPK